MNDFMTDKEFAERLMTNPHDNSADLLAAAQGNAAREALRLDARDFDAKLRRALGSVNASAELRQKLLDPAQLQAASGSRFAFLRRALPVAACLLVAIGIALFSQNSADPAFAEELFAHVYQEAGLLQMGGPTMSMPEINARLDQVIGANLEDNKDTNQLEVTFAKDCWVARQIGFHMVMKGHKGAVSVMMIPNSPVPSEYNIEDERFNGLVTPTAAGNLVVIGEKQEPIVEYRNLFSDNLKWEY